MSYACDECLVSNLCPVPIATVVGMSLQTDSSRVDRITAELGTQEFDRQLQYQASSAIQRAANTPLVRAISGLFAFVVLLLAIASTAAVGWLQIRDGFQIWDCLSHVLSLVVFWWLISVQGRIALRGEFSTDLAGFPRWLLPRSRS